MSVQLSLSVAPEVRAALHDGLAVVALESTIISHGLPRPRNLEVALELEAMLRAGGVVPATVGVIAGSPTVGLDEAQIETLATASDVAKVGVRELPLAVAASATPPRLLPRQPCSHASPASASLPPAA